MPAGSMLPMVILTQETVDPWIEPVESRKVPDRDKVVAERSS